LPESSAHCAQTEYRAHNNTQTPDNFWSNSICVRVCLREERGMRKGEKEGGEREREWIVQTWCPHQLLMLYM